MKPTSRQVLALWRHDPTWAASLAAVRQALGGKKSQAPALRTLLHDLVESGQLGYEGQRYRLPPEPTAASKSKTSGEAGHAGVFAANPNGYGFVTIEGQKAALFIPPGKIGGALDGDRVRARTTRRRGDGRVAGEVTAVLERARKTVRGIVHQERGETWVVPFNERLPMVFVAPEEESAPHRKEDVVEAEITHYPDDPHTAPSGHITRVIEEPDSPREVIASILADLRIPEKFSPETEREIAHLKGQPPDFNSGRREDLSALRFVTIDGEDAKDFDDAVYVEPNPAGGWRLWVAIADVAHFVPPGGALDGDAYARGTSVYFPQSVVPMLPELLSNDLCSLRPHERRYTLTCEMELDGTGHRTGYRIFEGVIESKARLNYTQVRAFLEGGGAKALGKAAPLAGLVTEMEKLARVLREKRRARGALDFEFPEARFAFEKGSQRPIRIEKTFPTVATRLIEQFMLEANETVAWHCTTHGIPALFRVHDPPAPDQIAELRLQLHNFGIETQEKELREPGDLNLLLGRIREHPARDELELNVLKAMTQALYRSRDDGHFALNAENYTHFTSPIRRYPDLVVHRALKHSLAPRRGKPRAAPQIPEDAGPHLSTRERNAGQASGRAVKLCRVLYMEERLGESFDALVSGINPKGLWIALQEHFVEGFLPISALPSDEYRMDKGRNVLRGRSSRRGISFGQRLTVQLARADRMTQELEFAFSGWDWREK